MKTAKLIEINRAQDLWMTDTVHAYFFPKGWCDYYCVAQGFDSGPDDDGEDGPQLYGYYPTHHHANSEVDTGYVPLASLEKYAIISEATAKQLHPRMFEYLDAINKGLV